jgi:hypothetical protein
MAGPGEAYPARTVAGYLADQPEGAVALFKEFRAAVLALGPVQERVHRTEVAWADRRVFSVAFILSGRLEVAIDLLRPAEHPQLIQAFPTTAKVLTHRFTITEPEQIDSLRQLLLEAFETVGPGTR